MLSTSRTSLEGHRHLLGHTGPATALSGAKPALGHHYVCPRDARPRRPVRSPLKVRRIPACAPRAVGIDSRRDRRRTPPTTRARPKTRPARRGTPCAPAGASRARRGAAGAVSGALASSWRAHIVAYAVPGGPVHQSMSVGGQGDAKSRSSAGQRVAGAPEGPGSERALCNLTALIGRVTMRSAYLRTPLEP
jgi:hypothetical protein